MKKVLSISVLGALLLGGNVLANESKKFDISMFPASEVNQQRAVIRLPEAENEANLKIEIQVGKKMSVDCNIPRFGGELTSHTIEGWGFSYLKLAEVSEPISTLMACPDTQKKESFIQVHGAGFLVDYNSRMPLVIYTPNELEVRYRLWRADELSQLAMIE